MNRNSKLQEMVKHQHSHEEERRIREATLDETIEETFPASDPYSHSTVEGRRAGR